MAIKWTAEELAAMQEHDAEVDAEEFTAISSMPAPKNRPEKPTYYQRNKEKCLAQQREYYQANKERIAQRRAKRYSQDPKKVLLENWARKQFNATIYAEEQAFIAKARRAAGLNQRELSCLVGVGAKTISQWENGYTKADWAKLEAALPELRERRKRDAFVVSG